MDKKTVEDIDVAHKRVLVRVDFNVPLDPQTGAITDDSRIKASLPTIQHLLGKKARIVLCSHLGRPKGRVVEGLRLAPVAERLSEILKQEVKIVGECIGPRVEEAARELRPGEILMLENIRFHQEEEKNDSAFANQLASLADVFVNDAFGAAHRPHASIEGVAHHLPAVAGFIMKREIDYLSTIITHPKHPFTALLGGAKVNDKTTTLENLLDKVDVLLIGGGIASTFLKAKGFEVGSSLLDESSLAFASEMMEKARQRNVTVVLPEDVLAANKVDEGAGTVTVSATQIPTWGYLVDIGPKTIGLFESYLKKSKTVFWNGPVGIFEYEAFSMGTKRMAEILACLNATTIVGGGSTAEVVTSLGLADKMSHVSTGGGASLEFLEGKVLPGIAVLLDR